MSFRTERDTMGEMQVPADALYGASTARAVLDAVATDATVGEERTARVVDDLDDDGARATRARPRAEPARWSTTRRAVRFHVP